MMMLIYAADLPLWFRAMPFSGHLLLTLDADAIAVELYFVFKERLIVFEACFSRSDVQGGEAVKYLAKNLAWVQFWLC